MEGRDTREWRRLGAGDGASLGSAPGFMGGGGEEVVEEGIAPVDSEACGGGAVFGADTFDRAAQPLSGSKVGNGVDARGGGGGEGEGDGAGGGGGVGGSGGVYVHSESRSPEGDNVAAWANGARADCAKPGPRCPLGIGGTARGEHGEAFLHPQTLRDERVEGLPGDGSVADLDFAGMREPSALPAAGTPERSSLVGAEAGGGGGGGMNKSEETEGPRVLPVAPAMGGVEGSGGRLGGDSFMLAHVDVSTPQTKKLKTGERHGESRP